MRYDLQDSRYAPRCIEHPWHVFLSHRIIWKLFGAVVQGHLVWAILFMGFCKCLTLFAGAFR